MASSCHVSVKPRKSIEEEVRRLKKFEELLLSDLMFNERMFNPLLEFEGVG